WLIKRFLLHRLAASGMPGGLGEVKLNLTHGIVVLHDLRIAKYFDDESVVACCCREISVQIDLSALLHGALVGQLEIDSPVFKITLPADTSRHEDKLDDRSLSALNSLPRNLQELLPFRIR